MLSPQLLIPPHSVQAEASGGTMNHETSKGSPMKLYGLCASLDPVQLHASDQGKNMYKKVGFSVTTDEMDLTISKLYVGYRTIAR